MASGGRKSREKDENWRFLNLARIMILHNILINILQLLYSFFFLIKLRLSLLISSLNW